ncbi:MAG: hypothetical protein K6E39_01160 [Lachnospiraceae bacterium]|nr:hypothetical protein [Lachnospiraceae bacterium]
MIINSSRISMRSTNKCAYLSSTTQKIAFKPATGQKSTNLSVDVGIAKKSAKTGSVGMSTSPSYIKEKDPYDELRRRLTQILFETLFKKKSPTADDSITNNTGNNTGQYYLNTTTTYYESESTTLEASACVTTADGREININLNISMSRTFYQEVSTYTNIPTAFTDPLIVNLDGDLPDIDSMDFFFDLDCDGTAEEISSLGEGSGFLALDKNEDGTINDGSELFGALSGNGFAELSLYDIDQNGFIDEADEIFEKLKVWVRCGGGEEKLLSLKDVGIGAIGLTHSDTNFALKDHHGHTDAYIRKTGFFLYEQGTVGTIQHVDFAAKA